MKTYFWSLSTALACCILLGACRQKEQNPELIVITPSLTEEQIEECKQKIVQSGDITSYESLLLEYRIPLNLPWALIMANKYQYPSAYEEVFACLVFASDPRRDKYHLENLDDETRSMALKYLRLAVEHGWTQSMATLAEIYYEGNGVPVDSLEGDRLMKMYNDAWAREKQKNTKPQE